ncbi:hypothetical protein VTN49DRAFT_3097 [Thermomyces lanuginosus]
MFAGPEPASKEEIRAGEIEARQTIQSIIVSGVLLYLSPFAVDFVKKFL